MSSQLAEFDLPAVRLGNRNADRSAKIFRESSDLMVQKRESSSRLPGKLCLHAALWGQVKICCCRYKDI